MRELGFLKNLWLTLNISLRKKEDLFKALKDKLCVSEKELAQVASVANNTKSFGDKCGIRYSEGVFQINYDYS